METKQKTLAACKDEAAKKYGFDSFNQLIKAYIINLDYVVLNSRIDEAAELYAGQTKQLEKTHGDENPAEFMRGKINEYFHDWRKSETDSPIIEIDGNTLSEITFKAELETKKKFPWIRYKQSHPVSEDVDKAFEDFWNFAYSENDLTTSDPEFDTIDHETCRKIFEAGFLANKSQQPASIAFLSDEKIQKFVVEHRKNGGCTTLACDTANWVQSELRKRVIDPVEFAEWLGKNRWEYLNGLWYCSHPANVDPPETTTKLLQIYLTHKTK